MEKACTPLAWTPCESGSGRPVWPIAAAGIDQKSIWTRQSNKSVMCSMPLDRDFRGNCHDQLNPGVTILSHEVNCSSGHRLSPKSVHEEFREELGSSVNSYINMSGDCLVSRYPLNEHSLRKHDQLLEHLSFDPKHSLIQRIHPHEETSKHRAISRPTAQVEGIDQPECEDCIDCADSLCSFVCDSSCEVDCSVICTSDCESVIECKDQSCAAKMENPMMDFPVAHFDSVGQYRPSGPSREPQEVHYMGHSDFGHAGDEWRPEESYDMPQASGRATPSFDRSDAGVDVDHESASHNNTSVSDLSNTLGYGYQFSRLGNNTIVSDTADTGAPADQFLFMDFDAHMPKSLNTRADANAMLLSHSELSAVHAYDSGVLAGSLADSSTGVAANLSAHARSVSPQNDATLEDGTLAYPGIFTDYPAAPQANLVQESAGHLVCEVLGCGHSFHDTGELFTHLQKDHSALIKAATKCPWSSCGKDSLKPGSVKFHFEGHAHHQVFRCPEPDCSMSFRTELSLNNHRNTHSYTQAMQSAIAKDPNAPLPTKMLLCPFPGCGKSFNDSSLRSRHKRTQHEVNLAARPTCPYCKKRFDRPDNLKRHCMRKENGEPPACRTLKNLGPTYDEHRLPSTYAADYAKANSSKGSRIGL